MSAEPDCKFYPMCDHKDFGVGIVCASCPWREARLSDARRALEKAKRRVATLTALVAEKGTER